MISEDDRRILAEAEEERDKKLLVIKARFKRMTGFLGVLGICLAFYSALDLGLLMFLFVGIFPIICGGIVELCMIERVLRKYLRICKDILEPDDDPDPDDGDGEPKPSEESESSVIAFPQSYKKAA
jgi:hypothetical protein